MEIYNISSILDSVALAAQFYVGFLRNCDQFLLGRDTLMVAYFANYVHMFDQQQLPPSF